MTGVRRVTQQIARLNFRKSNSEKPQFLKMSHENSIPKPLKEKRTTARIDLFRYLNILKGDLVEVLYGRDQGKHGVVMRVDRRKNTLLVEGCNMKNTFWNPRDTTRGAKMITTELPIHITNVAPLDPVMKKPTRIKRRQMLNGNRVRISKLSGCAMPKPVRHADFDEGENLYRLHLAKEAHPPIPEKYKREPSDHNRSMKLLSKIAMVMQHDGLPSLPSVRNPLPSVNQTAKTLFRTRSQLLCPTEPPLGTEERIPHKQLPPF